ncbi:MAG: hypothetical protein B5M53_05855 [Candidatus Cloacimonas sp. 4484_209]|nr:MAG: hypothetical protein B5M53_05855 [Candidatus Cloacimonas sp. 4484_209]
MKIKFYIVAILTIVILGFGLFQIQKRIDNRRSLSEELVQEMLYFPSGRFLKETTAGFETFFADLVWLRCIQYYGRNLIKFEITKKRNYRYLYHILDVLTTLDPYFIVAFDFGAIILAESAQEINHSLKLLDKGIILNPDEWRLPFIKGFIYYIYLRQYQNAARFFILSAKKPHSPDMPRRFAAFIYFKKANRLDVSFSLWYEIYKNTKNSMERETAARNLTEIDAEKLQQVVDKFINSKGRVPISLDELVKEGFIDKIPELFAGKAYYIDGEGKVKIKWE